MEEPPSEERAADSPPTVPCKNCGSTEPANEEGRCKCGCVRVGSKLAVVHEGRARLTPADLNARDALLARLLRERGGREALDIVSQLRVEDYATAQIQLGKVTRRLEMMGAVSDGGKKRSSLVDTYNLFSARVERLAQELPPPIAKADVPDDLANATNAQLIERTAAILRSLLELEHPTTAEDAGLPVQTIAGPTGEAVESTPALAPKPTCAYGCGTRCAELKETRLDVWRLFHFLDPAEVKRRDDDATAVMMKQVGRGLPAWYFE